METDKDRDVRPLTLVTGASRGIGAAIAIECASRGHDLVLVSRHGGQALEEVCTAARQHGSSVLGLTGDVSIAADVDSIYSAIDGLDRPLTGLVNNAAVTGERAPLSEIDLGEIDRVLDTNVKGLLLMCRAAIPRLAQSGGVIVNLSSQSAVFGGNGLSTYAASKAAVNGLTVSLAREVAGNGIRVVAVSPGPVMTEPLLALSSERLSAMEASLPFGRFCTVEEVARVVSWLMSVDASYISGAIVPVHGAR